MPMLDDFGPGHVNHHESLEGPTEQSFRDQGERAAVFPRTPASRLSGG